MHYWGAATAIPLRAAASGANASFGQRNHALRIPEWWRQVAGARRTQLPPTGQIKGEFAELESSYVLWIGCFIKYALGVSVSQQRITIHLTRGSHIRVTHRSVCNRDQGSSLVKIVLDCLIAPFRGSWLLDFTGVQRTKRGHASVVFKKVRWSLILVTQNSSWSLDRLQKRMLIAWFHFDPASTGDAYVTTPWPKW